MPNNDKRLSTDSRHLSEPLTQTLYESRKDSNLSTDFTGDVLPPTNVESSSTFQKFERRRDSAHLRPSRNHRQLSISSSPHRLSTVTSEEPKLPTSPERVTWLSLPRKPQLLFLTLARLSEPLANTSLQSYLYYQLSSFDPSLTPSQIATQAGIVSASFSAAQAVTSVLWGTVADSTWGGRKLVIIIGLSGTGLGCLGYGFAQSWWEAAIWRLISGSLNGNVGVMRTMISEIVKEKKFQSRAFLLMPLCFSVGVIIGPVLGGLLADPIDSYPSLFGPGSLLGGNDGVWWMKKWPYSLPNILSAMYLLSTAFMVFLFLEETHETLQDKPDIGIRIGKTLKSFMTRLFRRKSHGYSYIPSEDIETPGRSSHEEPNTDDHIEMAPNTPLDSQAQKSKSRYVLPLRKLFTKNVLFLLASHFLMAMGVGTYNSLWFVFLSTPRFDPTHPIPPDHRSQHPPFSFTGGLGLQPVTIGFATAALGIIGITMQLVFYPVVSTRLGTLRSYQLALCLFPIVYFLTPYLSLVPSSTEPPSPASGPLIWLAIISILSFQVIGRTFALPSQVILINNSVPHPSRLGTLHGIAQSVSSTARTFGPIGWLWIYGVGLSKGMVGLAYWGMAIFALVGATVGSFAREGENVDKQESGEEQEEGLQTRSRA